MKNLRMVGMVAGLIGGGICVLGGLYAMLLGVVSTQQGSSIPPALYLSMGLYFIGKGVFAAGISLNVANRTPPAAS